MGSSVDDGNQKWYQAIGLGTMAGNGQGEAFHLEDIMLTSLRGLLLTLAASLALAAGPAPAAERIAADLIVPLTDATGAPVTRAGPDGATYPVFRPADASPLFDTIKAMLDQPPAQGVLRLERWARQRAGHPVTAEPFRLALTSEEGGFPRYGCWIAEPGQEPRFVAAGYVELVPNEQSIQSGFFEEVFVHETGHLILKALAGELEGQRTAKFHQAVAVTDRVTAFDEGYAEHFQPMVRETTLNPSVRRWMTGAGANDLNQFWLSNADMNLRTDGVKRNLFIHARYFPEIADVYDNLVAADTSAVFATDRLRNPQEMLASEGVVATLFYRFVNDDQLRQSYRDRAFYQRFIPDLAGEPADAVSPEENVNLKIMEAFKAMPNADGKAPLTRFFNAYARLFPEDAARVRLLFIATTWGAATSRPLADAFVRAAERGHLGDHAGLDSEKPFERLAAVAADTSIALDAEVGPELWLTNPDFLIKTAPWEPERTEPLAADLNTASAAELRALFGFSRDSAASILAARDQRGHFASIDEVVAATPEPERARVVALIPSK